MDPDRTELPWRSGNAHGFCVTGGLSPIASEPTPSPRLWATPPRRDPGGAMRTYHEGRPAALNTGTFYFGGNRNFLLWSDTIPLHLLHSTDRSRARLLCLPFG